MAITGRSRNASESDPECLSGVRNGCLAFYGLEQLKIGHGVDSPTLAWKLGLRQYLSRDNTALKDDRTNEQVTNYRLYHLSETDV